MILRTRPWRSLRWASQLSQPTEPLNAEGGHKPSLILSRLSDRIKSDTGEKKSEARAALAEHGKPRPRAISFVSHRSAQKRDGAAEKWFADVPQLDFDNVDQHDVESLPDKKRVRSELAKKHQMRPGTDFDALFAHSPIRSAASLRLQTKRELGGDYTRYLPNGHADPYRLPVDYARLVLGRNKHIPLTAQTGALNIIQKAVRGRTASQGK